MSRLWCTSSTALPEVSLWLQQLPLAGTWAVSFCAQLWTGTTAVNLSQREGSEPKMHICRSRIDASLLSMVAGTVQARGSQTFIWICGGIFDWWALEVRNYCVHSLRTYCCCALRRYRVFLITQNQFFCEIHPEKLCRNHFVMEVSWPIQSIVGFWLYPRSTCDTSREK